MGRVVLLMWRRKMFRAGQKTRWKREPSSELIHHTVPYGTGLLLGTFQAMNCLATFIQSLRDKKLASCLPAVKAIQSGEK